MSRSEILLSLCEGNLLGSSPSLDGIRNIIKKYWFLKDVEIIFDEVSKNEYNIIIKGNKEEMKLKGDKYVNKVTPYTRDLKGQFRVIKKGKQFRFEGK